VSQIFKLVWGFVAQSIKLATLRALCRGFLVLDFRGDFVRKNIEKSRSFRSKSRSGVCCASRCAIGTRGEKRAKKSGPLGAAAAGLEALSAVRAPRRGASFQSHPRARPRARMAARAPVRAASPVPRAGRSWGSCGAG